MVRLCRFESHPGILLKDHLASVGKMCLDKCSEIMVNDCNNDDLCSIAKILGLTHDVGKYTEYFQKHLHGEKFNRDLISHAPLSALYTGWLLNKQGKDPLTIAIGILCVYYHHGSLDKNINELYSLIQNYIDNSNFKKQLDSLRKHANVISQELKELRLYPLDEFIVDVDNGFKEVLRQLYRLDVDKNDKEAFLTLYRLLLLFSILIDSDKKITTAIQQPQRHNISTDLIEIYLDKIRRDNNRLDCFRQSIRKDVMANLNKILDSDIPHILSINAPTGAGKTLLALTTALKLREKISKMTGRLYRIIYVLPYINIIEQTYKVFSDILMDDGDITLLLKHHHLYIPESSSKNDDKPNDDRLMLMESWDSEIIVTTFVQFMETLLGTSNRMLKKFHKLYNAIIILDEVQTIPLEYWLLIRKALLALSAYSYIIFMTATKPSIFDVKEYTELLANNEQYFRRLNRVKYKIHKKPLSIDELCNLILTEWDMNSSVLAIVNKISTSIELYKKLKESHPSLVPVSNACDDRSDNQSAPYIIYLSTNIVPKERLLRIKLINKLIKENKPVLVISTQLVEAGVDLDFDMVIRDIGPFDSIIQAGGRCNRNWNREERTVHIVELRSMRNINRLDAEDIYGHLTIYTTKEVLNGKDEFTEAGIYDMINEYYKVVANRMNTNNSALSKKYIDAVKELDLSTLSEFHIIKDKPTIPVYIEIDNNAKSVLDEFRRCLSEYNNEKKDYKLRFKLRADIRRARTKMEEYIVETWNDDVPYTIMPNLEIRYISSDVINQYYEYETGLKSRREDESYIFF